MDTPEDLDAYLADLLQTPDDTGMEIGPDERAFVDRMLRSISTGSKGLFVVLHPNERMQYMFLNANRPDALALLALVMQRTAEALQADLG
jgi:hypothetical protein